MKVALKSAWLGAACVAAFAGSAHALAIVDYDGGAPHLTAPTNQTSFEGFQGDTFPDNTAYVEDGISVTFVSASGQGVVSTVAPNTGERGWATAGLGDYTDIRMTNGSQMDEIQWQAEGCCETVIYYELLFHGSLIEPMNHFLAVGGPYRNFGLQAFGATFDEVRLIAMSESFNFDPFTANEPSALVMDDLAVRSLDPPPAGGVPEPATWGLLVGGFGLAGMGLRRRHRGQLNGVSSAS